jgi:dihydrofolate synthase/folylpolyglutamate synthase
MGGRTDSTNVCTPGISIITSISYDHTQQLGNTLELIAAEKAGIIKPRRPTISGVTPDGARGIIETICRQRESALTQLHVDFTYSYTPGEITQSTQTPSCVQIVTRARRWPPLHLNLLGEHQAANAALAIAAIEQLQSLGFTIRDDAIAGALSQVTWPARIEVIARAPLVILDCAHNIASAHALVSTLQTSFPEHMGPRRRQNARRSLLFAASRDKDLLGILTILAPHFDRAYLTQYTGSTRAASATSLLDAIHKTQVDLPATVVPHPVQAWQLMKADAKFEDLICVTGSVFLAGELRPLLLCGRDDE